MERDEMKTNGPVEPEKGTTEMKERPEAEEPRGKSGGFDTKRQALVLVGLLVVLCVVAAVRKETLLSYLPPKEWTADDMWKSLELTKEQKKLKSALTAKLGDDLGNSELRSEIAKVLTDEQNGKFRDGIRRLGVYSGRGDRGRLSRGIIESLTLTETQEAQKDKLLADLENGSRNPEFWNELEKTLDPEQAKMMRQGLAGIERMRQAYRVRRSVSRMELPEDQNTKIQEVLDKYRSDSRNPEFIPAIEAVLTTEQREELHTAMEQSGSERGSGFGLRRNREGGSD